MIQFNLLPDVKITFVKANRVKRMVAVISSLVALVTLSIMLILLSVVDIVQKHEISSNATKLQSSINAVHGIASLNQILTVQNQVAALPTLYNNDPVASKMFNYINQITPAQATISDLTVDFAAANTGTPADTISIQGDTDTLNTVQNFVDTMKFSTYGTLTGSSAANSPFTDVVLASFGYNSTSGASYTITANFNPMIFASSSTATLTIPDLITTRSQLDQPKVLFQPQPAGAASVTTAPGVTATTSNSKETVTNGN
jgi:hypothetical protein